MEKEIGQLNPKTGITTDYFNEFAGLLPDYEEGGLAYARKSFLGAKKYEERYSSKIYPNLVNEKNKEKISRLDEISDTFNKFRLNSDSLNDHQFLTLLDEVCYLIYGKNYNYIQFENLPKENNNT